MRTGLEPMVFNISFLETSRSSQVITWTNRQLTRHDHIGLLPSGCSAPLHLAVTMNALLGELCIGQRTTLGCEKVLCSLLPLWYGFQAFTAGIRLVSQEHQIVYLVSYPPLVSIYKSYKTKKGLSDWACLLLLQFPAPTGSCSPAPVTPGPTVLP